MKVEYFKTQEVVQEKNIDTKSKELIKSWMEENCSITLKTTEQRIFNELGITV